MDSPPAKFSDGVDPAAARNRKRCIIFSAIGCALVTTLFFIGGVIFFVVRGPNAEGEAQPDEVDPALGMIHINTLTESLLDFRYTSPGNRSLRVTLASGSGGVTPNISIVWEDRRDGYSLESSGSTVVEYSLRRDVYLCTVYDPESPVLVLFRGVRPKAPDCSDPNGQVIQNATSDSGSAQLIGKELAQGVVNASLTLAKRGFNGREYPVTAAFHNSALRLILTGRGKASDELVDAANKVTEERLNGTSGNGTEDRPNRRTCTRTVYKRCGNSCFGKCGDGCKCWHWVCGDCGCNHGCELHDYYCSCYGWWHPFCGTFVAAAVDTCACCDKDPGF